jgi:hypothetical protein
MNGFGLVIVVLQVFHNGTLEFGDALEGAAADAVSVISAKNPSHAPLDRAAATRGRRLQIMFKPG